MFWFFPVIFAALLSAGLWFGTGQIMQKALVYMDKILALVINV